MRAALALVVPAVLVAAAGPARAGEGDYDPVNPDWNGLSTFAELAEGQDMTVVYSSTFDWGDLDDGDVLVILYPMQAVEPAHLGAFLRNGGRLILADDFGKADEAFASFGLLRRDASGVHPDRWHEDNMALPVAGPGGTHPLSRGAAELVTNHPRVFSVDEGGTVVYRFGEGEALVVAGEMGDGRYVALADPSVLINGMLAFDGNATFAANLIDWLIPPAAREDGGGRLIVLTGRFDMRGTPPESIDPTKALSSVNAFLLELNKWLISLNDYIASASTMRALGMGGAVLVLLAGLVLMPFFRDRQKLDGAWTRAPGAAERPDFEKLLGRYDNPRWGGSYAFPAAVLRDAADATLEARLGVRGPLANLEPDDLIARVARLAGGHVPQTRETITRLLALPTREQTQALFEGRLVSRREFERAHDAFIALERALSRG